MEVNAATDCMVFDTKEKIEAFRLLSLKGRLKFEVLCPGMRFKISTASVVRDILGSKTRSKAKLLQEFEQYLMDRNILIKKG